VGIFSSPTPENGPVLMNRRRTDGQALSIIAKDMTVAGDLTAEGVVRVEGRVTGNVMAGGQILLCEGGLVEGDMKTKEAVLGGEVRGTVLAEERIEVQPTALVHGDLVTPKLLIHEGGRVNGSVRMETVPAS
jgi:cytoskeletal protein CcmA (bactofilin family)